MTEIEFIAHALRRMEERSIEKGLVVIYQEHNNSIIEVVTAVWADRRRLKRFGIATEKCRNNDDKFNDQVMAISCGLWNYHLKYC